MYLSGWAQVLCARDDSCITLSESNEAGRVGAAPEGCNLRSKVDGGARAISIALDSANGALAVIVGEELQTVSQWSKNLKQGGL